MFGRPVQRKIKVKYFASVTIIGIMACLCFIFAWRAYIAQDGILDELFPQDTVVVSDGLFELNLVNHGDKGRYIVLSALGMLSCVCVLHLIELWTLFFSTCTIKVSCKSMFFSTCTIPYPASHAPPQDRLQYTRDRAVLNRAANSPVVIKRDLEALPYADIIDEK